MTTPPPLTSAELAYLKAKAKAATPEGEPDFALLLKWPDNPCETTVELMRRMYRLGLAARPKVEDAEVGGVLAEISRESRENHVLDHAMLRRWHDLIEHLALEIGRLESLWVDSQARANDRDAWKDKSEGAEAKLAELLQAAIQRVISEIRERRKGETR